MKTLTLILTLLTSTLFAQNNELEDIVFNKINSYRDSMDIHKLEWSKDLHSIGLSQANYSADHGEPKINKISDGDTITLEDRANSIGIYKNRKSNIL